MKRFAMANGMIAVILAVLNPSTIRAQAVANATIHGAVTDATGAFVPNAQVKATQTETGQVSSTTTARDGSYTLPDLRVGPYRLETGAPAFSTNIRSGIILQVGNNVQIDVVLQVGAVTQNVQVHADAAMVETQETSVSEVIDQQRIVDLPLNGRQATDLILLSGGAAVAPEAAGRFLTTHDYATATAVSVSGGQENGNNYLLDGADHNDSHSNVNLPFPFPDALQEFSVQTSGVSARYGLHPYAVVNAVTKSGTNQFHGELFEFVRNGDMDARNFFAATPDTLRRNQFGGTGGGPIRKDKIFLFNGFQATRERTAPPQSISYVATPAVLNGDFSTLDSAACQSSGKAVTLLNPNGGQPFPGNMIPVSLFSTPALNLLKLIPTSSDPCGKLTYGVPNPDNENQDVFRVDWMQSAKNSFFGRFFVADYANPAYYTNNVLTTSRAGLNERATSVALGDQFSTGNFVNSFHATYSRLANNRQNPSTMPNPVSLGVNMYDSYPSFINLSVSGKFSVGGGSNAPANFIRNTFQFADDIDLIRGRHHITLGGEVIVMQMDEINIANSNGAFSFNSAVTNDALAAFMLGNINTMQDQQPFQIGLRQKYAGAYAQDDVRLAKGLNLHVGVRWEPSLPEHDDLARGAHFDLSSFLAGQHSSVYTNAPPGLQFYGDPGIPESYAKGSWPDFAPRVGLAWDPSGKGTESLRVSYGIFFDEPETFTGNDFGTEAPWGDVISLTDPPGGFTNPWLGYPGGNPFPQTYPPAHSTAFPAAGQYINFPLNLHHMYFQQWGLSLQRQLAHDWLVTANYTGNKATHLRTSNEENPAVYIPGATTANTQQRRLLTMLNPVEGPFYSNVTLADDGVNTNYNSLRLSVQHRFSQNFTVLSVYTWSKCLQDAETYGNRNSIGTTEYQDPYNRDLDYGPCDADLRHSLNASGIFSTPKFAGRAENQLLGHWQVGALLSLRTGFPITPSTGVDDSRTGVGLDRPNMVGNPYAQFNTNSLFWLNPAAFVANSLGTFGDAGYNSLRAPGSLGLDANVSRSFQIRERLHFDLRFEAFNSLNHTNFSGPSATLSSSTFGKINSSGSPRILQLAAKFRF
jgi:hypothetical protein